MDQVNVESTRVGANFAVGTRRPRVLIAATLGWPTSARVAMAFEELGWEVEAICWHGNPVEYLRSAPRIHRYSPLRPVKSLSDAILQAAPDLVVPCDDPAVEHLYEIYTNLSAAGPHDPRLAVLERSLGRPHLTAPVLGRAAFIAVARQEGVRAPTTVAIENISECRKALNQIGFPAMLKVDSTWGGTGVAQVDNMAAAERWFIEKSQQISGFFALRRLLLYRDPFWIPVWLHGVRPRLNAQSFVPGRPATCVVSCWEGEVLAVIQAEVLISTGTLGPSAVIRIIDNPEISEAAKRLVRRLGISGFCGLDFVIQTETNEPHLIEMNQRITHLGHLALGAGRDLVAALSAKYNGHGPAYRPPVATADTIVLFPQAGLDSSHRPEPETAFHDVPLSERRLVHELTQLPWRERGWIARLTRPLRTRSSRKAELVDWRRDIAKHRTCCAPLEGCEPVNTAGVIAEERRDPSETAIPPVRGI